MTTLQDRLRSKHVWFKRKIVLCNLSQDAADRIDQLEAQAEWAGKQKLIDDDIFKAMRDQRDELEAQVAQYKALLISVADVVQEAQSYTSCQTFSPSMTLELVVSEKAIRAAIQKGGTV